MKKEPENDITIAQVKDELGITDAFIGISFQYKDAHSYYHSTRRPKIEKGVIEIFKKAKEKFNQKE